MQTGFQTIDEYIAMFPPDLQARLAAVRAAVRAAAPEATEKISYQMPTFYLDGNLVYFAAFKRHIGFYPTPSGITAFQHELATYQHSKGALQFPHGQPLPLELIDKIVRLRVAENRERAAAKHRKKGSQL